MDKTLGQIAYEVGHGPLGHKWEHLTAKSRVAWDEMAAAVAAAVKEEDARICDAICDSGPDNGCCPTYWNEALERAESAIRASIKEVK